MSGGGWGLVGSEIWTPFHKKEKNLKNSHFWVPGSEFPYLGIISQYQVFLHNEPTSAGECNIYIIYEVELERAVAIQGMQENWILAIMPKYGNSAPGTQKMNFFGNF